MIKVPKINDRDSVDILVKSVDKEDFRALTHLRHQLDCKEIAGNTVLRHAIHLFVKECICADSLYVIAGISFQAGACLDDQSLVCIKEEGDGSDDEGKDRRERNGGVKTTLTIMNDVSKRRGIIPLNKEMRNWLASLLNRNDMFEGGINPIPKIYMNALQDNIFRSVTSGSYKFYEGMVHYAKQISNDLTISILENIIKIGISCMDAKPVLFAVREGGACMRDYTRNIIEKSEPKDECAREGLINLGEMLVRCK